MEQGEGLGTCLQQLLIEQFFRGKIRFPICSFDLRLLKTFSTFVFIFREGDEKGGKGSKAKNMSYDGSERGQIT
jgi:hypothetical protein